MSRRYLSSGKLNSGCGMLGKHSATKLHPWTLTNVSLTTKSSTLLHNSYFPTSFFLTTQFLLLHHIFSKTKAEILPRPQELWFAPQDRYKTLPGRIGHYYISKRQLSLLNLDVILVIKKPKRKAKSWPHYRTTKTFGSKLAGERT